MNKKYQIVWRIPGSVKKNVQYTSDTNSAKLRLKNLCKRNIEADVYDITKDEDVENKLLTGKVWKADGKWYWYIDNN